MKLLIFGATGACGKHVVEKALAEGHEVTVFVRNSSKLPHELGSQVKVPASSRSNTGPVPDELQVIQGSLSDERSLRLAVKNQDAIISTLGPSGLSGYSSFSPYYAVFPTFYKLLLRLMRECGVRRLLAMSTFSLCDPKDKTMISTAALVWLVWLIVRGAWREFVELGDTFHIEGQDIDWTLYRVGVITDAIESETRTGFVGDEGFSLVIGRKDMATWLVEQATIRPAQWVGQMPAISSLGKAKVSL